MNFQGAWTLGHIRFMLEGFAVTLQVAVIAIILSFILGTLIGVLRYTRLPIVSPILAVIVETLRNLPLLLIIMFVYLALPELGIRLGVFYSAVVGLTVFEMAMISEIVRGGLMSVDKGQTEAARASGMTYTQTLWHIVLPQALVKMIPPTVSQFISLLKDTSLAVAIALPELMHNSQIIYNGNPSYINPILLLAALFYFVTNFLLSQVALFLERRLRY